MVVRKIGFIWEARMGSLRTVSFSRKGAWRRIMKLKARRLAFANFEG
jgi:hypothetical protein